jgi:translocation and assembly module TamB
VKARICLCLLVSAMVSMLAAATWILNTNVGARLVLTTIARSLPGTWDVREITGSLARGLRVQGIQVRLPNWEIQAETLEVSWQPLSLVTGTVTFRKVLLRGVSVVDLHPEMKRPLDLSWPRVPGWLLWLKGAVKVFAVDRFVFGAVAQRRTMAHSLRTEILWYMGSLVLRNLEARSSLGTLTGTVAAGFARPYLSAGLTLLAPKAVAGCDGFTFTTNLAAAPLPEQVSGPVTLSAFAGKKTRILAEGGLAVKSNGLIVRELRLTEQGRRGNAMVQGLVDFSAPTPGFDLEGKLIDLDLERELGVKMNLTGAIRVSGNPGQYSGSFTAGGQRQAWKRIDVSGRFQGDSEQVRLTEISAHLFDGTLTGVMAFSWVQGSVISGDFQVTDLNPAGINADWKGQINGYGRGSLRWSGATPLEGAVKAEILESVLWDRALTGRIDATWQKGQFRLAGLDIRGRGFDLTAKGALEERLVFHAKADNLAGLVPGSGGRMAANGWVRIFHGHLAGVLKGSGSDIVAQGARIGSLEVNAELDDVQSHTLRATLGAQRFTYGDLKAETISIRAGGPVSRHHITLSLAGPEGTGEVALTGGYEKGFWEGAIDRLTVSHRRSSPFRLVEPSPLRISFRSIRVGPFALTGGTSERLDAFADLELEPIRGIFKARWENLDIGRINPFVDKVSISGRLTGSFALVWISGHRASMSGSALMHGEVAKGPVRVSVSKADVALLWNEKGLMGSCNLILAMGGTMGLTASSREPASGRLPNTVQVEGTWDQVDMAAISPWLPESLVAKGRLSGKVSGRLLPDARLEAAGNGRISAGEVTWRRKEGLINASLEQADLHFEWKDRALAGNLALVLKERGHMNGSFRIPLIAHLPPSMDPDGLVHVEATGRVLEKGLVSALFPGLVEKTQGTAAFEIAAAGTWRSPRLTGWMRLEGAEAIMPATGAHLTEVGLEAELSGDRINVTAFRAKSGPGSIQGSAVVILKDWEVTGYSGKITGKDFQAVYLPELQVMVSPDLAFEGDMKSLFLRGSIEVPEALVRGANSRGGVRSSPDVVLADRPKKAKRGEFFNFNAQVMVILGDRVRVNTSGIDARLEGKVLVSVQGIDRITGDGRIRIARGEYAGQGMKLQVTQGSIVFGGPVGLASLDIVALKTINPGRFDEVKAGITVTGTPRAPLIKLYSEPAMPETDVLSYIVLGRPMGVGTTTDQNTALLQGAGTLMTGGQGAALQDRLAKVVGIESVGVESGSSSVSQSLITIGKHLAPGLYLSYGRSLFGDEYRVTARYSFSKRLEVETKTGVESSVDLYYRIEFH